MKLTAKIKLNPTPQQAQSLLATLTEANAACNALSDYAFEHKVFKQFNLHKERYYPTKATCRLSSQMIVRCLAKVADSYRLDKKTKRTFRDTGAIAYDSRILTYRTDSKVANIWTIDGRQKISYVGGTHNESLLQNQKGESDLLYTKGKWFLLATCDIADEDTETPEGILGVDLGIVDLATDSDGERFTGSVIRKYRKKRSAIRASLQAKKHNGAKKTTIKNTRRLLKRLSKKEQATSKLINHTISKRLVGKAKDTHRAIALEDLKAIRDRTNQRLRKSQKREHNSWPFYQLRTFISYKAQMAGVQVVIIPPAYTSKTCSNCLHIGRRSSKHFTCSNCGYCSDADVNGARNIAAVGGVVVTRPENSPLVCAYPCQR